MANYKTGKLPKAVGQHELTEEEKRMQVRRLLAQKRESLAQGALFNLCQGLNFVPNEAQAADLVERSVQMADQLMEKLFTVKDEGKDSED